MLTHCELFEHEFSESNLIVPVGCAHPLRGLFLARLGVLRNNVSKVDQIGGFHGTSMRNDAGAWQSGDNKKKS
jgi:hypothetical protein